MSTYAWAIRPGGLASHRGGRGRGGMHALLGVLRVIGELVAFSYRLRTGRGVRGAAAR
jgi:hypothetical protein